VSGSVRKYDVAIIIALVVVAGAILYTRLNRRGRHNDVATVPVDGTERLP